MYKVEHLYSYGWDDADWHDDDKPWRFATIKEALDEIEDFCSSTDNLTVMYRVVPVN